MVQRNALHHIECYIISRRKYICWTASPSVFIIAAEFCQALVRTFEGFWNHKDCCNIMLHRTTRRWSRYETFV